MIIEVRPTPARRWRRARVVGAMTALLMIAATLFSVAELAGVADSAPAHVPYSDPAQH
jgi:hypothetical protein